MIRITALTPGETSPAIPPVEKNIVFRIWDAVCEWFCCIWNQYQYTKLHDTYVPNADRMQIQLLKIAVGNLDFPKGWVRENNLDKPIYDPTIINTLNLSEIRSMINEFRKIFNINAS